MKYRSIRPQGGFTLIEMLITVVIMTILASVALPSYRGFVAKSVRTQAKRVLMTVADRQEQYFLDNKIYADDLEKLGFEADPLYIDRDGFKVSAGATDRVYQIKLSDLSEISFTVSGKPLQHQAEADERCGTLILDHTGQRSHSGPLTDCW